MGRKKNTNLPIIVKGVQSVADVELCVKAGVEGVLLVSIHADCKADVSRIMVVGSVTSQCVSPIRLTFSPVHYFPDRFSCVFPFYKAVSVG